MSEGRRLIDVLRLKADLEAAGMELLSAHCATDRIRLQYSPQEIVAFGKGTALKKAIAPTAAMCRFFSQVERQLKHIEDASR